jgi:hypothetical protein
MLRDVTKYAEISLAVVFIVAYLTIIWFIVEFIALLIIALINLSINHAPIGTGIGTAHIHAPQVIY